MFNFRLFDDTKIRDFFKPVKGLSKWRESQRNFPIATIADDSVRDLRAAALRGMRRRKSRRGFSRSGKGFPTDGFDSGTEKSRRDSDGSGTVLRTVKS